MKYSLKILITVSLTLFLCSCKTKSNKQIIITPEQYHASVNKIIDIMIHDIFSPPVASRVFVYPNIAAYEILAQDNPKLLTLDKKLNQFTTIPKVNTTEGVNLKLAALIAHLEISKKLIFSEDKLDHYKDSLYTEWKKINKEEFTITKNYSDKVIDHVTEWMNKDNYKETRTMPKFTVDMEDPSRWQPTPPSYMDGIEPHWNKIRPFILDSASQFKPIPPPEFSLKKDSKFYQELLEVYNVSQEITKKGDNTEEIEIAQFWDCNPFVSVTRGHFMFATKKISPGAHWILISQIASKKTKSNFEETVNTYTKTSIAIADAFISCWDEKYRSNLIRPETVINQHIDPDWLPILQTPPFPEYVSGHSVVSGSASVVLTKLFGDNFAFNDTSEIPYGLPARDFKSFYDASAEAALSRLYGGIHYRAAIDNGLDQGKSVGHFVAKKLGL
ncbi:vanadium-dependent haloperoxidase [Mesoflavibacter zeaxanthinifaciens]|uniref:vanadium-dependent haloperoxidase n=1 Tax=Mesoflavibacter zeaxanthinifaciens TaxID=393060 RepID=UPI0026EBB2C6|nr:vanadium-dependent haloperoxidase [Mesoflavibacter zeaxanthinifaciens]